MSRYARGQSIASMLALTTMVGLLALEMAPDASWKIRIPMVIVFVLVAAMALAFAILTWFDRPKRSKPQATEDSPAAPSSGSARTQPPA